MGQFKMKRVYEPAGESDGYRVLVDRLWPRGMTRERIGMDIWLKEVAPGSELIRWFGHRTERFEEFRVRYIEELNSETVQPHISRLLEWANVHDVTLLYSAKDEQYNQAIVLKHYLEERRGRLHGEQ
jgi:Uncharacterized conserved protein